MTSDLDSSSMEEEALSIPTIGGPQVDDDDQPVLSAEALAALQEFLSEQNHSVADAPTEEGAEEEVALVTEDWRLSQFWYDRETAETVANEVVALCGGSGARVACIACPTLFAYLKVRFFRMKLISLTRVCAFPNRDGQFEGNLKLQLSIMCFMLSK